MKPPPLRLKLRESILKWLRLVMDNGGLDSKDGWTIPERTRRHLVRMGFITYEWLDAAAADGVEWCAGVTDRGRVARRTERLPEAPFGYFQDER